MNKRVKMALEWAGSLAIIFIFCKNKSVITKVLWILAWNGFVGIVHCLLSRQKKKPENRPASTRDPRFDTPCKVVAMLINFGVSNLLFYLNPLLATQSFLQIAGIIWEKIFGRPVFDAKDYQQKVNYILPVTGEWHVFNGCITQETSHSWSIPSQRFAYDLVKMGPNGRSFDREGRKLEDYFFLTRRFSRPQMARWSGRVMGFEMRRVSEHFGWIG